jgi:putative transposase
MPNYRRAFVPGGCWFFTANLLDRRSRLLTDEIETLREATRRTLKRHPFRIDAFVVLPETFTRFGLYRKATRIFRPAGD